MEVAVFAARAAAYLGHYRKSAQSYQNNETHHAANAAGKGNGQWAKMDIGEAPLPIAAARAMKSTA